MKGPPSRLTFFSRSFSPRNRVPAAITQRKSICCWVAVTVATVLVIMLIARAARRSKLNPAVKVTPRESAQRLLQTRPLPLDAREDFTEAWRGLQGRFSDEPEVALRSTDRLLQDVMRECGYPTGDFGRVSEEVKVEQAEVLDNYRTGHRITVKGETTMLGIDEIQQAVSSFRAVFKMLTGASVE